MVFFMRLGFLQWRKVQVDLIHNFVGFIFHFFPAWVALSVYEAYWGLDEKPFENTPDPRFLYRSEDVEDLYTRSLYTLSSRHGEALISGESGCGKTMMARTLLHELDPDKTEIALLSNPCCTAEEFLREILFESYIVDPAIEGGILGGP
jgi:type II secretory pathway predicted ATPase ExeA